MQFPTNNTLFIGKNLITLGNVDSTNNYAKLLLANSGPVADGTVILAEAQHGGRGQGANSWHSEPGKNLTFSVILNCSFLPPSDQFYLSMAVSLGIIECIASLSASPQATPVKAAHVSGAPGRPEVCALSEPVRIKWPNDIYTGKKKLGGILIENMLAGPILKTSVIGIGINVNQEHFPGLDRATSLKLETNRELSLNDLLQNFCSSIEARYLQLKGGARRELRDSYLAHLLGYGQMQRFMAGTEQFEGVITGIAPEGRLLVKTGNQLRSFDKKQIEFIF